MFGMEKDLHHMEIRLFQAAFKKWGVGLRKCADIFDEFEIDRYIRDAYEFFHIQGDEANLEEIEEYLHGRGLVL